MVPFFGIMTTVSLPPNIAHGLKFTAGLDAEWLRVNDTVRAFGLSRPSLFQLIATGQIRSAHIKRPGAKKGIRLISVQSVRDYIGSFEEAAR
jgi:hypothetical protein